MVQIDDIVDGARFYSPEFDDTLVVHETGDGFVWVSVENDPDYPVSPKGTKDEFVNAFREWGYDHA